MLRTFKKADQFRCLSAKMEIHGFSVQTPDIRTIGGEPSGQSKVKAKRRTSSVLLTAPSTSWYCRHGCISRARIRSHLMFSTTYEPVEFSSVQAHDVLCPSSSVVVKKVRIYISPVTFFEACVWVLEMTVDCHTRHTGSCVVSH